MTSLGLVLALLAGQGGLTDEDTTAIDEAVRELVASRPSAALSIGVRFHGTDWTHAYGLARLDPAQPATPSTTYRMASVTKTFTGVAIMQLVEQGKVKLDAEVQTYLPKYPKKPWPMTVRQLLTHLSGTDTYRDPKESHLKTHHSTAQALALFQDWPLKHEPGTHFLYSTYGYDVLGAVVEAASGESYGQYLQHHVFGPCGMSRSGIEDAQSLLEPDRAYGYRVKGRALVRSEQIDISSRFAGGGTRSTVEDLLRYAGGLFDHTLVKPETWAQMTVPARSRGGEWVDYGLGFGIYPQHGHLLVTHLGGQPETTTLLVLVPDEQLAIALATNVEGQSALLSEVSSAVIERLLESAARRRALYADDPADAVLLEGMSRTWSYGLARRAGWGGDLPPLETLDATFERANGLLSRSTIERDLDAARTAIAKAHHVSHAVCLPRVGQEMAAVLEAELGPERVRAYAQDGPISFFADYLEVCRHRECRHFSPEVEADVQWLALQWHVGGEALAALRADRAADLETLTTQLEPYAGAAVLPDLTRELKALATHWRAEGRSREARAALELGVRMFPFSAEAQLQLADAELLDGEDERAEGRYQLAASLPFSGSATTRDAWLKRAVALEATAPLAAATVTRWAQARPAGAGAKGEGFR